MIEEVRDQKTVVRKFTLLFNKGSDYWKHGNTNYAEEDEYANNGQFDNERKRGLFKSKLGDKMSDIRSHEN